MDQEQDNNNSQAPNNNNFIREEKINGIWLLIKIHPTWMVILQNFILFERNFNKEVLFILYFSNQYIKKLFNRLYLLLINNVI